MPEANPEALNFLRARRSRPAKTLTTPVPNRDELTDLLTIAARCPDHGKLEPWRFLVLAKPALTRLASTIPATGDRLGVEPEKITKAQSSFSDANLAVAVIASPKPSDKIPEAEQILSAGALCSQLLNVCLAAGWGANWLSGWASHDRQWREENLGLMPHETIAGFIHIGTERAAPPDRPRPDIDAITEWIST